MAEPCTVPPRFRSQIPRVVASLLSNYPDPHLHHYKYIVVSSENPNPISTHQQQSSTTHTSPMALIPSIFGGRRSNVFDPFSLDVWDPFEGFPFSSLTTGRRDIDTDTAQLAATRIDWRETPEAHVIKADLPGIGREEVKVEVEDGRVLQISGERRREKEDKGDTWHRVERSSGRFMRRFRLPEDARMDQVTAKMENGVLIVTVPKTEMKRPEVKSIEIGGGSASA